MTSESPEKVEKAKKKKLTDKQRSFLWELSAFLIFILAGGLFFGKALWWGETFFGEDYLWQFLPMNQAALEQLKGGDWPLWNPYMMSGMPLFGSLSFPLFYPGSLLFYFLPQGQAVMGLYAIQLFLAGYFTYRFFLISVPRLEGEKHHAFSLRFPGILAGISFMLAGNLVTLIFPGHTMKLMAATFIPIVIFCLGKAFQKNRVNWYLLTALVLGLQIFTLHFQVCYYTWLLVSFYSVWEILTRCRWYYNAFQIERETRSEYLSSRLVILLIVTALLAVGLTAVQWLPFWEYSKLCNRSGGMAYQASTEASFPPEELLSLMMVSPFGDHIHPVGNPEAPSVFNWQKFPLGKLVFPAGTENYQGRFDSARTLSEYLGVLVFLLAGIAFLGAKSRNAWFMKILLLVSAFLCLGKFNPLYPWILKIIPGLSMFRVPAEILLLFAFALSILAGMGLRMLLILPAKESLKIWNWLGILWGILGVSSLWFIYRLWGNQPLLFHYLISLSRWILLSLAGIGLMKLLIQPLLHYRVKWLLASLILMIIIFDLWSAHQPYLQPMKLDGYYAAMTHEEGTDFLRTQPSPYRILPLGSRDMVNNKWIFSRLESAWGYQSFPLNNYEKTWAALGYSNPAFRKMANVKYILADSYLEDPELELAYDGRRKIYREKADRPRAWIPADAQPLFEPDMKKSLALMKSPEFNPETRLILNIDKQKVSPSESTFPLPPSGEVLESSYTPQQIDLRVSMRSAGYLLMSEVYYPGWMAYVDGEKTTVYQANGFMRALWLEPGLHEIKMIYHPGSFYWGLKISLLFLLILITGLLFIWIKYQWQVHTTIKKAE